MDKKPREHDDLDAPLLPASALVDRGRRDLLKLVAASMALAGLSGCTTRRSGKLVPYVREPRGVTPGIPNGYATSMIVDGYATGLVVQSHEGRPTKIEGNPDHPASLGAAGVFEQALVLGLYDPDRARAARSGTDPLTFERFVERFGRARDDRGRGLRFLLEPTSSPLVSELIARVLERAPEARFTFYSPLSSDTPEAGAALVFGQRRTPQYDISAARVILSIDADFLSMVPFHLRYARDFAKRRRIDSPEDEMNRLYVIEAGLSTTGTMADHRLHARPSEMTSILSAIAAATLRALSPRPTFVNDALLEALSRRAASSPKLEAIGRDLALHRGKALILVGQRHTPLEHAIAHIVNAAIAEESIAWFTEPILLEDRPRGHDITVLADELKRGAVDTLVILSGNPAYTAPADLEFGRAIASVPQTIYLGLYEDETAQACKVFIPVAHDLESWADARAYDGTLSLIQPLIDPLYGGRTPSEILAVFAGEAFPDARRLLHDSWQRRHGRQGGTDFEIFWETSLRQGFLPQSAEPRVPVSPTPELLTAALDAPSASSPKEGFELVFVADASVYDGRFTNNPWLQEMPDPITKLSWDNAARVSTATAKELGVETEDVLEIEHQGRTIKAPLQIVRGHADGVISLPLGYGRVAPSLLCHGKGFNAYRLRTTESTHFAAGASARKVPGEKYALVHAQKHSALHGRPIALSTTLARYREHPDFTSLHKGPLPSLMPEQNSEGEQWAMTIDLSICTGCSACVVACQAENNVLVVGKESVAKGREMLWLRIDSYDTGDTEKPEIIHQPMMCQHCELAPCEYVCPVNATVHSPDGLNEMIYNRCVGTRFCSNNCPYKVRRFNWFDWMEEEPLNQGRVKLQRNPEVTVRQRGVMEKCTYCVQRIRKADIQASIERRTIEPGEVVTACQQACPTKAIQFGSLSHTETPMVAWRNQPRSYAVLHDTGARPRTHYLARITNPNPEID